MSARKLKSKNAKSKSAVKRISRAKTNTFRAGVYSTIYDVLFKFRRSGISKQKLLQTVKAELKLNGIKKSDQQILYSVQVVVSSRKDKLSHISIRQHSDFYFVIKNNDNYRLHLKDIKDCKGQK